MSLSLPTRFLEISGNDYEAAQKQGEAFKEQSPLFIEAIREIPLAPLWIQKRIPSFFYRAFFSIQGKKFWKLHQPFFSNYKHSRLKEKFLGLASGLKESVGYVYGLNAFEPISSKLPYQKGIEVQLGCTSLAFSPTETENHHPLLAYNHDFPYSLGTHLFVRKNVPEKGYRSLSLTYPAILGAIAGINEKGLAVTVNHAYEKNIKFKPALFVTLLLQECLDHCSTISEALSLIQETPVTNGSMLTFVDAQGERIVVEVASSRKGVRHAPQGILYTFNKYRLASMEKVEVPLNAMGKGIMKGIPIHGASIKREKRFLKLIEAKKTFSESEIITLLSDHDTTESGGWHTICRHHTQTSSTLASALIDPVDLTFKVFFGFPCRESYQEFTLDGPTLV